LSGMTEQIRSLLEQLEAKDKRIVELEMQLQEKDALLAKLVLRIEELERRVSLTSANSSKPPSSDGLKKPAPKSLREKSRKPGGGQVGHKGKTLKQEGRPDEVVVHAPVRCPRCAGDLHDAPVIALRKRQVIDMPAPHLQVTEHQAQVKHCPCCGCDATGDFPGSVRAPVQYGPRIQALSVYLQHQQMIPEDRLETLFEDIFGRAISATTLVNMGERFAEKVAPFAEAVRQRLCAAPVKNLDETGLRVATKLHWLHVMSNQEWTCYRVAEKRGEIPQGVTGTVVHDHFKPYYTLQDVTHGLCGAHHLRELKGLEDIEKEPWAKDMSRLLKLACRLSSRAAATPATRRERLCAAYDRVIAQGLAFHEALAPLRTDARRGRKKRRLGHNLLLRLRDYKDDVLRCLSDPHVPFTNNQAEQDIRMMKVKQKISGGFRTLTGAQTFATIRTFLSTMRKQGINLFYAISHPDCPAWPAGTAAATA
jgi:transposase